MSLFNQFSKNHELKEENFKLNEFNLRYRAELAEANTLINRLRIELANSIKLHSQCASELCQLKEALHDISDKF